jgi:hypothetical protein
MTCRLGSSGNVQGLDVAIQAALMTSGFVLVDDAFIGHTVDNWHGQNVSSRLFSVFCVDGFNYILDVGTNHGTQAGVVAATLLSLFCTFLAEGELATVELLERLLGNSKQNRPRIMPMSCSVVKAEETFR